jgi:lipopolysaccharide assembly protein A
VGDTSFSPFHTGRYPDLGKKTKRRLKMYFSLIITFLLLLGIIIASIQNSIPLEIKFITWKLHLSLTALMFYSALIGAAIVAILTLPKLVSKGLKVRGLNKEINEMKRKTLEPEKKQEEKTY